MNHVRIIGDPFEEGATASLLRGFLRQAVGNGMRVGLSLAAVRARPPQPGQRPIHLTDGVRSWQVGTSLPPAEVDLVLAAGERPVVATAPVVVFAAEAERPLAVREAGLAFPRAATVLSAREGMKASDLLERVRAELRWSGPENPPHGVEERDLEPLLQLPPMKAAGPLVFVGSCDFGGGLDLLLAVWPEFAAAGRSLRIVLSGPGAVPTPALDGVSADVVAGPLRAEHLRDAAAVVLPWRRGGDGRDLVLALASGRPVCASRVPDLDTLLGQPGTCFPVGGRLVAATATVAAHFAPDPGALRVALRQALASPAAANAIGQRARCFVIEECLRGRPSAPPLPADPRDAQRPLVVLEAPLFETSSSAELTLATAQELQRRGVVDLRLVPTRPLRGSLVDLRRRAPELEPLLSREPGRADLWLSSGWPVRSTRPHCRSWALRVDWEYGALPHELTPHVSQQADIVVVHSAPVQRLLVAAGRSLDSIALIPHGVDAAMHEQVEADPELLAWKAGRPAVLFCGGMIWRKGFDLFLRAVLQAQQAGQRPCIVIKTVGQDQHYGHFHLGELVERCRRTKGAPPIHVIDRDLSRAELARVYAACDLLLHPYRGEGFCLPVLEARAVGLPVLATADGAAAPLLVGPGGVPIPASPRAIDLPGAHVGAPWVLEPDAAAVERLLVEALVRLPALREQARAFAPTVRAAYRWEQAAIAIEQMASSAQASGHVVLAPVREPIVRLPQAVRPLSAAEFGAVGGAAHGRCRAIPQRALPAPTRAPHFD